MATNTIPPYNEQFFLNTVGPLIASRYKQAGRQVGDDAAWVVWPARIQYDIAAGMDPSASLAKHDVELCQALGLPVPFHPAPREWRGNMCGVRVPGIQAVPGGSSDATLVLSWFYDRYTSSDRASIRNVWKSRGITHIILSWPDSRAAGQTPAQFGATCDELIANGFYPCVFLCSKDYDPADVEGIGNNVAPVIPYLVEKVAMICVGWELSLWLSPAQVQQLIDNVCNIFVPAGSVVYVHFQSGYFAYQPDGGTTADFWNANVGKLIGILHQRDPNEDNGDQSQYQARITDCLVRFAGGYNFPSDSGFGHPFDFVACEITAMQQFNGQMDEATGNSWGQAAINTPPSGAVSVMGSGNGF